MEEKLNDLGRLSMKDRIVFGIVIGATLAGFVMLFIGMFIPPEGEIHNSVLIAWGGTMVFVALLLGIIKLGTIEIANLRASIPVLIREAIRNEKEATR